MEMKVCFVFWKDAKNSKGERVNAPPAISILDKHKDS